MVLHALTIALSQLNHHTILAFSTMIVYGLVSRQADEAAKCDVRWT